MLVRLAFIAAVLPAAAAAAAQGTQVLGFELGARLDLPLAACTTFATGNREGGYCTSSAQPTTGAISSLRIWPPLSIEGRRALRLPSWVSVTEPIELTLDSEQRVEQVQLRTISGPSSQPLVVDSISPRFGPPRSAVTRAAQNAYGATVQITRYEWANEGLVLTFDCSRLDRCNLTVATEAAHHRRVKAQQDRQNSDRL